MTKSSMNRLAALADMTDGQEADLFALMTRKEELKTRDGKTYYKVGFRDARREVKFPVWADSAWAAVCRDLWKPGECYKLRAVYRDTQYGPQLDIHKIRAVVEQDHRDGFDPASLRPGSARDPEAMFEELLELVRRHVTLEPLQAVALSVLTARREAMLRWPAAARKHHAYAGGLLEHTLAATRTTARLCEQYDGMYPDLTPRLNVGVAVAGAALHDVGKLDALRERPEGAAYTAEGALLGHLLQGRDVVRDACRERQVPAEVQLRLEHVLISHEPSADWGAVKPTMTPEAMLVRYAVEIDVRYQQLVEVFQNDPGDGTLTSNKNIFQQAFYRGP